MLEVGTHTARAIEAGALRRAVSVDAYLRQLLLEDSIRSHAAWQREHPGEAEAAALKRSSDKLRLTAPSSDLAVRAAASGYTRHSTDASEPLAPSRSQTTWATVSPVTEQHTRASDGLPPLAPPDADDEERARAVVARFVARFGAPPLEDYRRVYASMGFSWPGDDEIRSQFPVADPAASSAA